jgi:hypothetical protein
MMKKKRLVHLAIPTLLILGLFLGCGTNKNLNPLSDLRLQGADPPSMNVGVSPPVTHQAYFRFLVTHGDANLSLVASDAWTVDKVTLTYEVLSDTGHHLLAPPPDETRKVGTRITVGGSVQVAIVLVTDAYLQENAQGFAGTSDTATVKLRLSFQTHRNSDGARKTITSRYYFNIGNF